MLAWCAWVTQLVWIDQPGKKLHAYNIFPRSGRLVAKWRRYGAAGSVCFPAGALHWVQRGWQWPIWSHRWLPPCGKARPNESDIEAGQRGVCLSLSHACAKPLLLSMTCHFRARACNLRATLRCTVTMTTTMATIRAYSYQLPFWRHACIQLARRISSPIRSPAASRMWYTPAPSPSISSS